MRTVICMVASARRVRVIQPPIQNAARVQDNLPIPLLAVAAFPRFRFYVDPALHGDLREQEPGHGGAIGTAGRGRHGGTWGNCPAGPTGTVRPGLQQSTAFQADMVPKLENTYTTSKLLRNQGPMAIAQFGAEMVRWYDVHVNDPAAFSLKRELGSIGFRQWSPENGEDFESQEAHAHCRQEVNQSC
ncbi:hypothetical protein FB451DRAFT_1195074 [Mycena latifolia]|nr:hypothetical protein FB451DRAFT_1195074 [Mycena latifolia]